MAQTLDLDAVLDTAIASHQARDLDRAERLYRDILDAEPDHAEALNLLGLVLQDHGELDQSIVLISRAIEIDPDFPDALANLARGFNFQGQPEKAADAARKATELDPSLGEGWLQLGRASLALARAQDTLTALNEAVAHFPDSSEVRAGIGWAALMLGDLPVAEAAWRKVLDNHPDRVDALVGLGSVHARTNRLDEALASHRRAVELAPDDVPALGALAGTRHLRFEPEELIPACRALLDRDPGRPDILTIMAAGQIWLGQFDAAIASLEAALTQNPHFIPAHQLLVRLRPDSLDAAAIARLDAQMQDPGIILSDRVSVGFIIAGTLEKRGDFDGAFRYFQAANGLYRDNAKAAGTEFQIGDFKAYADWARRFFTPTVFHTMKDAGNPSDLPVFIVGMPRSGTSLVEQIAASHPEIHGAGERRDLGRIVRRLNRVNGQIPATRWDPDQMRVEAARHTAHLREMGGGARRVIDKMPDNIKILGQIRLLFPNARIIVCRRDPRDICLSCFSTHFGENLNWTWDIEDCARQFVEIDRLMDHWRTVLPGPILEIDYETLVANMETESRRLIGFLGVDWNPACLTFHETERPVMTASVVQVRQPVYQSSVGKWRRYEPHLAPMLQILEARHTAPPPAGPTHETPLARAARLGQDAMSRGDLTLAVSILRDAAYQFPLEHDIHEGLGIALAAAGDIESAVASFRQAAAIRPDSHNSLANLGMLLVSSYEPETKSTRLNEGIDLLCRAAALAPDQARYHQVLGEAYWNLNDYSRARDACRRGLALAPDNEDILLSLGHCEATLGEFEAAAACYRKLLELNPDRTEAWLALTAAGKSDEADNVADLHAMLADPARGYEDRVLAGFTLGKTLETAANYDGAFAAFHIANTLIRENRPDEANERFRIEATVAADGLTAMFGAPAFQAVTGRGNQSDLPVFVVGVPRSGTSLVEQILASHPGVVGVGERIDIQTAIKVLEKSGDPFVPLSWDPAIVSQEADAEVTRLQALGDGAVRVIDKLPGNVFWLGHVRMMLPNAKIIVCRRDPRDVGLSCYFTRFATGLEWTNDLDAIAAHIRAVDQMIAHWRAVLPGPFIEVQYEHLVGNLEAESRRLVDFLGLDWDPACLQFHRTRRAVNTASAWQVKQPLYDRSIGRWRHYERHLGPLLDGLPGLVQGETPSANHGPREI